MTDGVILLQTVESSIYTRRSAVCVAAINDAMILNTTTSIINSNM